MISYIANGDYNFPFDAWMYFMKHFYMWSFQTGTPNPDGIIRLPGRIFNMLVFATGGNISIGYFYQIACLVVTFLAFYFFARKFLVIKQQAACLIGALFFAINPIYLGNLSKVGLILAVAMLPLCLIAIKQAFDNRRFSILLLWVVCLNISMLHPYTFFVNLGVSGLYFLYLAWLQRDVVRRYIPALAAVVVLGITINTYFLLPIASMGTVSKDAISDTVTPMKGDYTAIVDVANTGDVFTGLALSKNIFLDFDFYSPEYQSFYFLSTFLLYIVLLVIYLKVEKKLSPGRKRTVLICFACFLVLIALAAVNVFNIGALIKTMISLPGGWAFRSPLKWQLYIPLALFTILVILLVSLRDYVWRRTALAVLGVSFVLMNGYQLADVIGKQFTPRQVMYFKGLVETDLKQKNLLFVNSSECIKEVIPYNSPVVTELNQIFTSSDMQVKRAWADSIAGVNIASYDYVLTCRRNLSATLKNDYNFTKSNTFVNGAMELYKNQQPRPLAYAADMVYTLDGMSAVVDKQAFVVGTLNKQFNFVDPEKTSIPTTELRDMFAKVQPKDLANGAATVAIPSNNSESEVFVHPSKSPLFSKRDGRTITLSPRTMPELSPTRAPLGLPSGDTGTISYNDANYDFKNLIKNPSLEEGLWRDKPDDCFNFDSSPNISMKSSSQASDGKSSLELASGRHVACTGPDSLSVRPGEHYLLHFDYQSPDGPNAGYYVGFDENGEASGDSRLTGFGSDWQSFSKEITVPANAKSMRIQFYAYPDDTQKTKMVSRYDNVSLIRVPPLMNRFYQTTATSEQLATPRAIEAARADPTKWNIHIKGATKPFYLLTKETYHAKWQLSVNGQPVDEKQHFAANNTMNGWYIDPVVLCRNEQNCKKSGDQYDFELKMTFLPQQWFYIGGVISGVGAILGIGWYIYEARQPRSKIRGWR
mgnify:CR=1 FL=1